MNMQRNFTQGPILAPLVEFAVPVFAALFLQMLYGAVDMMIVGMFCPPQDIAACNTASSLMMGLTVVVTGLAMGTTILMGQKFGEGRTDELGDIVGGAVCLFGTIGVALAIVMQFAAAGCITLMHTPPEAFAQAAAYVRICCGGAPFIVAYNVLGSVFRGIGNSRVPLIAVAIACVVNIIGDWLLVGKVGMGVAGAAVATVAAQAFSVAMSLFFIAKSGLPFSFGRKNIRFNRAIISKTIKLGLPIAFQDALVHISFMSITTIINSLRVIAAAGVGIAERVVAFVMLVPSTCGASMAAFTAQNVGAAKPERARKALVGMIAVSLFVGLFMFFGTFFHGDVLCRLFVSNHPEVVDAGWQYLKSYSIDCLLTAFLFSLIGYFNGWGQTRFVMWQGIIGAFCVRIPVSWLMSRITPVSLFKVGLATPASSLAQIILCLLWFMRTRQTRQSRAKSRPQVQ